MTIGSESNRPAVGRPGPAPPASARRGLFSTGAGNALEWFDWAIFATFVPFFATQFFPAGSAVSAVLSGLAVFAVGFVFRPLGGALFGWCGDRFGRRVALIGSIGLAAAGSLVIGLSPTFTTIGYLAPILLVLARLAQGLGHGGEMPAVQTYIAEAAPPNRRGLWSSMIYMSGTVGILASTALGALLAGALSTEQMTGWGWRIPFLLGGVLGVITLIMRARLSETESFTEERRRAPERSMWRELRANRTAMLRVVGLNLGSTVAFYAWVIAAPTQAIALHGLDPSASLWAGVVAQAVMVLLLPVFGARSDRVGRKPLLLFSFLGTAIMLVPLNLLIGDQVWQLLVAMTIALIFVGASAAVAPVTMAEMFPTQVRTTGAGVPYALVVALFGGTAPYLQTWLNSSGLGGLFLVYAIVLLLVSAAVVWRMPETGRRKLRASDVGVTSGTGRCSDPAGPTENPQLNDDSSPGERT